MRFFIFLISVLCLFPSFAQSQDNNQVINRITEKLEGFKQHFPLEKVYILTDKEIYSPGEIIWFCGFVYNRSGNHLSDNCQEMTVNLYDESGNLINGDRFPVKDGKAIGDILLPEELPLGRYYLASFTPFQTNPEDVCIREIAVDKYYETDAIVSFSAPDCIYEAGKEAKVELKVTDFTGSPVDKFLLNYKLRHGNKTLAEGKIHSSAGIASIPVTLPAKTGNFPVELIVSNPRKLWTKKIALKTSADEIHLKFYVEGENLVGNSPQKMGFYATVWDGIPVRMEADIIDPSGQLLTKVKTISPGFGFFPYKATVDEKDKLVITSDYGRGQTFELPGMGEIRIAWSIFKTDEEFITADLLVAEKNPQKLTIAATKGYNLLWAARLEITNNARIKIPVVELEPGIIQLNAFDEKGNLLTSRLVYIPDKKKLDIIISADTEEKEKVKITLKTMNENKQPVAANLILSIADKMRKTDTGNSLNEYILLDGELDNSPIEKGSPAGNFSGSEAALDNLLVCNGLKCFSWSEILNYTDTVAMEKPINNFGISGRVTDKRGNPAAKSRISILNSRNMRLYSATADKNGTFEFSLDTPVDKNELTISAFDENGKGNLIVKLDPAFSEKVGMKIKTMDYLFRDNESHGLSISEYLTLNPSLLSEQPSIKPIVTGTKRQREDPYKIMLESASNLLDVIRIIKPFTLINNQIVFYGTINSINAQSGALIVFDGQKMGTQIDVLNTLNPHDVDKINVSLDPMDIQKYTGFNNVGVIEITTKKGEFVSTQETVKKKEILYQNGYRVPRNFLTSDALMGKKGKDMRTTLYWNPNIETGPSGTITFSIPLSEIKSDFVISAEGITSTGLAGHSQQVFRVR
jgi:hypothetical protein